MNLTKKEKKQIEDRKEAIRERYGEQVARRIEAGHIPPLRLAEVLKLPVDAG